ncbi:cytochrome P450 [Actinomadura parmotrematis]|uniref:Cytochrome P450 n=1 Tax=Actinomadura parmotrematis TaxID=2864039 RepID=A0ABS7G390_9ACTN|nr:cytochrome P450 [Actinomadura parmotrematis]MBW8487190.1 cytochrome P450 [Actinomadura parmotrematis]
MTAPAPAQPQPFDPLDPAFLADPHPTYAALRATAPVVLSEATGMWFVTGRALVAEALGRPEVFSSRFGVPQSPATGDVRARIEEIRARGWEEVPTMLTEDPPAQTRYRRLVSRAFGRRSVEALEPEIRDAAAALAGALADAGRAEFVADFAVPLPVQVIAKMLGVPADRHPDVKRWTDAFAVTIGADATDEQRLDSAEGIVDFQHYFADLLERRRADPREDVVTGLVQAHLGEDEAPLTVEEILSIVQQLLVAGNETTTKLLTGLAHRLATDPPLWDALRADPAGAAPGIVEEGLRLLAPVQGMFRLTTEPAVLGGVELPAGAMVVLAYASANRDEDRFEQPDAFRPGRPHGREHMAFGWGIHHCLGAPLARKEAVVALEELARRLTTIELADAGGLAYDPSFLLRGIQRLPLNVS